MSEAESIRRYYRFFQRQRALKVLDYGTGTLRNALFLADKGFHVFAADLSDQITRLRSMSLGKSLSGLLDAACLDRTQLDVDLVVSNFVFNILPDDAEKERYLGNVVRNLRRYGFLLLEVRCQQNNPPCGSECTSFMKCKSCVKTFSHLELDLLVMPFGFKRLSHYYRDHSVAALYQLIDKR